MRERTVPRGAVGVNGNPVGIGARGRRRGAMSRTTWLLVRDRIEAVGVGAIDVKGFHQPVEVYEVVGERAVAAAAERT